MTKNKKFDENYDLLDEMYSDPFFPDILVDKVKNLILELIKYLETGETSRELIQKELDKMTLRINELEDEFFDNNSEIETMARESIARSVEYVLSWFKIRIDVEDALRLRNW